MHIKQLITLIVAKIGDDKHDIYFLDNDKARKVRPPVPVPDYDGDEDYGLRQLIFNQYFDY